MSISDDLSSAKYALNSTIGQGDFKPLDKMLSEGLGGLKTDVQNAVSVANSANSKAENALTEAQSKLSSANPKFSGGLSSSGSSSKATGNPSIAIGIGSEATKSDSFAFGYSCTAEAADSFVFGSISHVTGRYSAAFGSACNVSGEKSFATGYGCYVTGDNSVAMGYYSGANGLDSVAMGSTSNANAGHSVAIGYGAIASAVGQVALSEYNKESTERTDKLIVGKGSSTTKSNCLRVTTTGVYASGDYNSSGADFAEKYEWKDGNINNEDRVGLFVTLDGEYIKIANSDEEYILGVVSGCPSVVGDSYDDQWQGMYLKDIYGRPIWETVRVPDELDEEGNVIVPSYMDKREKINPEYDDSIPYIKRSDRPEWDAIGSWGKLVVRDDGTCMPNGFAKPSKGGIATNADYETRYRVMKRLDDNHIKIVIR